MRARQKDAFIRGSHVIINCQTKHRVRHATYIFMFSSLTRVTLSSFLSVCLRMSIMPFKIGHTGL